MHGNETHQQHDKKITPTSSLFSTYSGFVLNPNDLSFQLKLMTSVTKGIRRYVKMLLQTRGDRQIC